MFKNGGHRKTRRAFPITSFWVERGTGRSKSQKLPIFFVSPSFAKKSHPPSREKGNREEKNSSRKEKGKGTTEHAASTAEFFDLGFSKDTRARAKKSWRFFVKGRGNIRQKKEEEEYVQRFLNLTITALFKSKVFPPSLFFFLDFFSFPTAPPPHHAPLKKGPGGEKQKRRSVLLKSNKKKNRAKKILLNFLSDLVVDHVLEVFGDLARLVGLDRLLDLHAQRHDGAAALALARARGDVAEALRAGPDGGLGVEVLEELDERQDDQKVDDEADGDERDERVDKVA